VTLPHWTRSREAALDITVVNPLAPSYLPRASKIAGAALEARYKEKMSKHHRDCEEAGIDFIPLVVESLGGWEADALLNLKRIGHLTAQRLGTPASTSTKQLFQRLAVVLQRGNANLILGRIPEVPPSVSGLI
jgi:hypothetical protein